MPSERILVVEDDETLLQVLSLQLKDEGYETQGAASAEEAISLLAKSRHHLVITDLNLPGKSGLELLKRVRRAKLETSVIVMTAFGTVPSAVEAMREGAFDYITKPVQLSELKGLITRCLGSRPPEQAVRGSEDHDEHQDGFEQIIGHSTSLRSSLNIAAKMALTDANVLIVGETGTGKELVAKAIHLRSNRHQRPFTTINCGAIPRELLESELFGHVKGSFTGALAHKKGKVELADGGTLLLDEIGEMPLELQVRILRLIQEREIEKIGATSPINVDVRIIAATHRNLAAMVKDGGFREDLYYRLLVVPIYLPPLRDRLGDIPELVHYFFAKWSIKHGRPDLTMEPGLTRYFSEYSWPGNVRQLENAVERMVLLTEDSVVTPKDLPDFVRSVPASEESPSTVTVNDGGLEAFERQLILDALKKCRGNQSWTARYLKMSRRALAYRLEKYGIRGEILKTYKQSSS